MHLTRAIYFCIFTVFAIFSIHAAASNHVLETNSALETNRVGEMTNSAIGQHPSLSELDTPAIYYTNREKALKLVREEKWRTAKPVLESLTSQYADDGDTWYILGLTYFQLGDWEKSITAFKRTLALGTILSNIPTGSAPANDIMIKIAEAYAELGDEANAISWINQSLQARYDGRKDLVNNDHFKSMANSKAFQKTSGSFLPENLSRIQSWQYDLEFLISEIKRLHVNLYHSLDRTKFEQMIVSIRKKIPELSDQEIVFELMKLVAAVGNGHNFIVPAYAKIGTFHQLPLQFYQFSDGLFIVKADQGYEQLVGSKVVAIGSTVIEEALTRTQRINARDNEMQQLWLGPHYLGMAEVLKGLDIVDNAKDISLILENRKGTRQVIKPRLKAMSFNGFPKLPALANTNAIHNLRIKKRYWYQAIPEQSVLYIQYNYVHNDPSQPFEDFNIELRNKISALKVDNIILDLRHNAGGDGSTYPPLLKTLVQFEASNPDGKLFVIMGRNTFSAAHNLLLDINRLTSPILVGEPSGSRPNALSEAGWFKLPYSGTWGIISTQFHQASKAEDHRIWVAPHVPAMLSSKQYFSGQDPAMNAIFEIIKTYAHKAIE
ncbi:tetratricopeptide repeat protein [Aliikangiella sp. G2MR2-5]|uniref:tetratricopeptide repeat protein n=1 Tax=Aliikangiella sp. G2MR2-5 TaxID=2788943 RepID=UPI0018AAFFB6|nr:tetratricopeptide repeat protein [Aliikangiella sp. G2MR2-5]